jgi:hypothetical protein
MPCRGKRLCFLSNSPYRVCSPPDLLFSGYRGALSAGVKRLGREADHSPHLVPRLRVIGAISQLLNTPSWREHAQLYLILSCTHAYVSNFSITWFYLPHYNADADPSGRAV